MYLSNLMRWLMCRPCTLVTHCITNLLFLPKIVLGHCPSLFFWLLLSVVFFFFFDAFRKLHKKNKTALELVCLLLSCKDKNHCEAYGEVWLISVFHLYSFFLWETWPEFVLYSVFSVVCTYIFPFVCHSLCLQIMDYY